MTQLGQTMQDLSKGYVPIVVVISMIATAFGTAFWLRANQAQVENVDRRLTELQNQVAQLSSSVAQLTLTLAKGPQLPDNVAYKADLLKFCIHNRELKCPDI